MALSGSIPILHCHETHRDKYFCTEDGAKSGVIAVRKHFEDTSETESFVTIRYVRPGGNPDAPVMDAYRTSKLAKLQHRIANNLRPLAGRR